MSVTVKDVISELTKSIDTVENTVDKLKFGEPDSEVAAVAISFMPAYEVIEKAIELGANLLICHEGLSYSHWDDTITGENQVYEKKAKLIKHSNIAIYRTHDYIHRYQPDGIMQGMIHSLQWESFVQKNNATSTIVHIPEMTVKEIIYYIKNQLGIDFIRYVGDPAMICTRIALLVGYRGGGTTAIPPFEDDNVDLVIYGEGPEWETPEYVRDANAIGKGKALLILGHLESEEPGMVHLANELREKSWGIPVHFIPTKQCINIL